MYEPQPDLIPAETDPALDADPGLSTPAVVEDALPFPGTGSNEEVATEVEFMKEVKKPRRRLRLRLAMRRPALPNLSLGWNTRFKAAVVLSFLILVSVLIANRVNRGARAVPPKGKAGGDPLTLAIASGGKASREPDSRSKRPPTQPKSPPKPSAKAPPESADDPEAPPTIRDRPFTGDGLIQASGSAVTPPEPVEPEMSVAMRESESEAINPPLPADEPPPIDTTAIGTPEPADEPPALAGVNPPVPVDQTSTEAPPVIAVDATEPPSPTAAAEPPDTQLGAFQGFQDLPLPGSAATDPGLADPADPALSEPPPEADAVASMDSQPTEMADPSSVETMLAPPVDSREDLAGSPAGPGLTVPGPTEAAVPAVPGGPLTDPQEMAVPPDPGSTLAMPGTAPGNLAATAPETAAVPTPAPISTPAPTPAPPPSNPSVVAAGSVPTPIPPSQQPTAPTPAPAPSEPATLMLAEVPRTQAESEGESRPKMPEPTAEPEGNVVGSRIQPITHVVRRGENFYTIAQYYYGSGRFYRALWKANADRVPKIDVLYVGTKILVPAPEDLDKAYIDPPDPQAVVGSSPSSSLAPGMPMRPDRDDRAERTAGRRGEVELALPRVIPTSSKTEPLRTTEPEIMTEPLPSPRSGMRVHVVQPYETLRSIAREELGDSRWESELLRLNADQVADPYNLAVGLRLRLPEGSRRD